ncbi:MAG: efflux transporter outer membrane subunit [Desulfosarcinaceae bacterium]
MKTNLTSLLGLILLLAGCTLAPKYTQPQAPVPDAWPEGPAYEHARAPAEAEAQSMPAAMPWREFFSDAHLRSAIETALTNNRDLRLAALNVQRARALYGIQRSELYPAVSASASGNKQRIPADLSSTGQAYTAEQYDVNLGILAWEIDFFGRIRSLKDRALQTFLASEQAARSARILIVSAVADTYLALAADREHLSLAQTTLSAQEETYRLIKKRYDAGLATDLDLNRAKTQVDAARVDVASYMEVAARDQNALNLLAGTPSPVEGQNLPSALSDIQPLKKFYAGLSSQVLLQRPDVLEAEYQLKAAHANIGAARAALFPRISLTTTVGTASSDLDGLFASGSDTWRFAPQIAMPLFDARLWSALDATRTEREIVLTQYEKTIQTAFREVADALAVQGTMNQRLSAQQSLVDASAATYRLADARYTKGIDSYLGVLDAQRALYAAQQGYVTLRQAHLSNQVRLYAVLGGGVE